MFQITTVDDIMANHFPYIPKLVSEGGGYLCTDARSKVPPGVDPARWSAKIVCFETDGHTLRHGGSGAQLAEHDVVPALDELHAAFAAVDELRATDGDSRPMISDCLDWLRTNRPDLFSRFAVFIAAIDGYDVLNDANTGAALDGILRNDVVCACELYVTQTSYCAPGHGDTYLKDWFRGNRGDAPKARIDYLVRRRGDLKSKSKIWPIFGTTKRYLNPPNGYRYLDHLMYVWQDTFGTFNAGSYKWEDTKTEPGSLDQVFHDSWLHYQQGGAPRMTPPYC